MKDKRVVYAFAISFAIAVIPLIGPGFLVQDNSPSLWVKTLYDFITKDLMWRAGLTTPFYPTSSSIASLYNGIAAPFLELLIWLINRTIFSPLNKKELQNIL